MLKWRPVMGGAAGAPRVAALGPAPTSLLYAAVAAPPTFSLGARSFDLAGTAAVGVVTLGDDGLTLLAGVREDPAQVLFGDEVSRGDSVFLVGALGANDGFVLGLDADLQDVHPLEVLDAPAARVGASPDGGAVVVVGVFTEPVVLGGHPVGALGQVGSYAYSFDPG